MRYRSLHFLTERACETFLRYRSLHFLTERACETFLRYRSLHFLVQAGMRDLLALPLASFSCPSGHARSSCVTARFIFLTERACETFLRYRSLHFFDRAGMRDLLALPLSSFSCRSGHARSSCVTARFIFLTERACETFLRYRSLHFLTERACETFLRYRSSRIFRSSGMLNPPALPFSSHFPKFGHDEPSSVTFLLKIPP